MKCEFHTLLFNNRYVVGYHTNLTSGAKTLVTQHYTYTDDHIKELLWPSDQLLTHAHHIANDNHCVFKGDLVALEGSKLIIYIKVQTLVYGHNRTKAQILQFGVTCNPDMLILIQLCTLLYSGSDPLTMCMFTDAAPGFQFVLVGIHVTLIQ